MLKAHLDAIENQLIATSQIPANAGHTLHRGTPRETFIKEFLEKHLSSNVSIGSGEIIDANSKPHTPRNQYDIVIYKNNYPKLDFGGSINGFLIESVVATIEVKSLLDQAAIDQSVEAAKNSKTLKPNLVQSFSTGWIPPKVLNYVIAYDGPEKMETVYNWIINSHLKKNIPQPSWNSSTRLKTGGTALDGVILLKKGFIKLDNTPFSLNNTSPPNPGFHTISNSPDGNLLLFFLALQEAINNVHGAWLNPNPYLQNAIFRNVRIV
ncbi:DUF6602 domain-containing protein [Leptospira stimsonii]|uniref:DUF6602 domain-containing protein n=1 Tax=Leptospira stimsonii TaxID=2202203 RepID=A0ABY2N9W2_9LEPT|nr:DUF6602 domain-containing protein [Leptospira stimsonii]TGK19028.1 hypothetical protein EHO98_12070 [Leptospira stimsonii]TGM18957.1 hypothetical protein EHQ90_05365 [Leptospira stimsonii]